MKRSLVLVAITVAFAATAFASSVTILNAGFEYPQLAVDDYTEDPALLEDSPGWDWELTDINASRGAWNVLSGYGGSAPEGQNVAYAYAGDVEGGIKQTLTETLVADTIYTLTVSVGNHYNYNWGGGYKVQLFAGPILLNEDDNSQTIALDTFELSTVTFDSTGVALGLIGLPLEIRLLAKPGNDEVDFDNVQLTAVPEPATMCLLAIGGLMLRRKRK